MSIVFAGHLNSDVGLETVIGTAGRMSNFLPRFIHWGNDPTSSIPDSLKVYFTELHYTTWQNLNGSASIFDINSDT